MLARDARAAVANVQAYLAAFLPCAHRDRPAFRCIADGVLQKIADRLLQLHCVALQRQRLWQVDRKRLPFLNCWRRQAIDGRARHGPKVQACQLERLGVVFHASKGEQVDDQFAHLLHLGDGLTKHLLVLLDRTLAQQCDLHRPLQDGERRPQLMRCADRKTPLAGHSFGNRL